MTAFTDVLWWVLSVLTVFVYKLFR
jgi:hypothetical protein